MLHYTTLHLQLQLQLQLQLHYIAIHCNTPYYTNYITLHFATLHSVTVRLHYITFRYNTLQYTSVHSTALRYTTTTTTTTTTLLYALHYPTLHYTRPSTPLPVQFNCKCSTLITVHHNYNSTTLQLQLRYTTLHPAVVGDVTTATLATTLTNTTPTTFRSISGFALPSVIHNNQPLL